MGRSVWSGPHPYIVHRRMKAYSQVSFFFLSVCVNVEVSPCIVLLVTFPYGCLCLFFSFVLLVFLFFSVFLFVSSFSLRLFACREYSRISLESCQSIETLVIHTCDVSSCKDCCYRWQRTGDMCSWLRSRYTKLRTSSLSTATGVQKVA